jgi:hypothetical protein
LNTAGAVAVEPKEKELGVGPVAAVVTGADVAPNPNIPPPPLVGAPVDALVAPVEPNENGLAEAIVVGAVVVKPSPNANGVALAVVYQMITFF